MIAGSGCHLLVAVLCFAATSCSTGAERFERDHDRGAHFRPAGAARWNGWRRSA